MHFNAKVFFCINFTGFFYVAFIHNYMKAKNYRLMLPETTRNLT